jgi:hypothetical protein
MKNVTPAFDRVFGKGLALSYLTILFYFRFDVLLSLVLQKV